MRLLDVDGQKFVVSVSTLADTPRAQLDAEAASIYALFADREREFGFNPNVVVEYPSIENPQASSFITDPTNYIAARVADLEIAGPISRVVVLTTYGQNLLGPLTAAGFSATKIDMPAGPDNTLAFSIDYDADKKQGRLLYLEAVNEADEKIRPTFVLKLTDNDGRLCGGACGAVHARDNKHYAYLATLTLIEGLPATTGARFAAAMIDVLRSQGVSTIHLGTQTAGRFYEKLGLQVTHRLVQGVRTRPLSNGRLVDSDLMMLALNLDG